MSFLGSVRIAVKLPVMIVTLCFASALSIAVLSYVEFRDNIVREKQESFSILTDERRTALATWLDGLTDDVITLGSGPTVVRALNAFNNSFNIMATSETLQAAYITDNPNPIGEKDRLDRAPGSIPYHFQHLEYHPYFRQLKNVDGYYDIFLFNLNGDMVYSVYKELDFATNFETGPYRQSGLGNAFRAARAGEPGQVYFSDFSPYAPSDGAPASFLATPVFNADGQMIGVFAVQVPGDPIASIMTNPVGLGETGDLYIIAADGQTRSPSRFNGDQTFLVPVDLVQTRFSTNPPADFFPDVTGLNGNPVVAMTADIDVLGKRWRLIGEMDVAEVMQPVNRVRNQMILVTALIAGLAAVLGWLAVRSVVRPLNELQRAMVNISENDYDTHVANTARADELGGLSRTLVAFRDKLHASEEAEEQRKVVQVEQSRVVERLSTALSKLAEGDLTDDINMPFQAEYDQLRQNYNRTILNLNSTLQAVVDSAARMHSRSDEMSSSSDELSARTENQAATLEQTAAALDQLTSSVKAGASSAKEVETVVANAQLDADESGPVVRNAVDAMTEIETSSEQISQIIGVIDDIAFQTNLLALNAGVEAARAGEAGRGFAVVASEVRALAQRSSDAAKQIKTLISGSSEQVGRGVALVGQAGAALTKIVEHINHISGLMTEIASSAEEQSTGLAEINAGVTQLDKVTQQNAAMVEKAAADSHEVKENAAQLSQLVTKFKLSVPSDQKGKPGADTDNNVMVFRSPRSQARGGRSDAGTERAVSVVRATGTNDSRRSDDQTGWEDF